MAVEDNSPGKFILSEEALLTPENVKKIGSMAKDRLEGGLESDLYKGLQIRFQITSNMLKLKHGNTDYRGRYGVFLPVYKTSTEMWRSATRNAYNNKPFVSVVRELDTSIDNVNSMQTAINWNNNETEHKRYFHQVTDDVGQIGIGILKHSYDVYPNHYPEMVESDVGQLEMSIVEKGFGNDYTYRVHPLNYLQDQDTIGDTFRRDGMKWVCEISRIGIREAYDYMESPYAVKDNVNELIKYLKGQKVKALSDYDNGFPRTEINIDRYHTDVAVHMYGTWPIDGNERDDRLYYIIFCEKMKKVIYIKPVFDHPYTKVTGKQNLYNYLGQSPTEGVISANKIMNLMSGKSIENVINNLQRYVFYMADSGLKPEHFQNKSNNGIIPVDFRQAGISNISQALQEFQGKDINVEATQNTMAMLNDYVQRDTHQNDLFNYGIKSSFGGGLNHAGYSATGADLMDKSMKVPVADYMDQIGYGLEAHWNKKMRSLQQFLPDYMGKEILGEDADKFRRYMLFGKMKGSARSGLKTNKAMRMGKLQEVFQFIQGIIPLAEAAGQPINANFQRLIKTATDLGDFPDADEIFPGDLPQNLTPNANVPGETGGDTPPETETKPEGALENAA